jgi:hypothetical protein
MGLEPSSRTSQRSHVPRSQSLMCDRSLDQKVVRSNPTKLQVCSPHYFYALLLCVPQRGNKDQKCNYLKIGLPLM